MNSDRKNQRFITPDNLTIGFAEYGAKDGVAVFHFNGSGGSRLGGPIDEHILNDLNIRYISTDRPGMGLSSSMKGRKLLDWPATVASLADHLGIDTFHVLGTSAGGPYALVCAYKLPDRVISGALVNGLAPPDRPKPYQGYQGTLKTLMFVIRTFPKLAYPIRWLNAKFIHKLNTKNVDRIFKYMPEVDRKPFENLKLKEQFVVDVKESLRQGGKGVAQDDIIVCTPWGFDIKKVSTKFDLWQGVEDKNVPMNQAIYQSELLPNCELHLIKGKGHMLILDEWERVLGKLIR